MKPTYKELQKQLTESRREFTAANATIHNLELKVEQVVAENAALKSAIDATVGWQQSTDAENVESVRMLIDIQTTATDAYLAEVRAQGVEEFLTFCGEENSVFVEAKAYYRSLTDAVDEFAAQLRQGAES